MRAMVASRHGGPEVLQSQDWPEREPADDEVVIDAAAIGVNFLDATERDGRRPTLLPFVPGHEGAGVVSRVGCDVNGIAPGDRVGWACPIRSGSYASSVTVPARWTVPLPQTIDDATAASVLIQGLTAHYLAHDTYAVEPGDTVLVHAAAGGVGLLRIHDADEPRRLRTHTRGADDARRNDLRLARRRSPSPAHRRTLRAGPSN